MMVYVGAITILFSFSVMLTRRTIKGSDEEEEE
jgi:NADH:ubiquinone oxidoreductase subunit 6 (subunit J)